MAEWVRLRTGEGQFYDREIELHIRGKERKPLPDQVPPGGKTDQRLAIGGLIRCDPPADATQEACQGTEGQDDATPSDPATIEPDLGDSPGQAVAETDKGAADSEAALPEPVEEASPAPNSKKRATRKKAQG